MEKAWILKWMSTANGNGNDLIYYKKAKNMARIIQVLYISFSILTTAMMAVSIIGIIIIIVTAVLNTGV